MSPGHAFDQMENRGIPPTVVESTIRNNTPVPSGGNLIYMDKANWLGVVTSQTGDVITVGYGLKPKP